MDSGDFLFKKWYRDDGSTVHSLYVERYAGPDGNLSYHCVVDDMVSMDVRPVGNRWEDAEGRAGRLVRMVGVMIEGHIS